MKNALELNKDLETNPPKEDTTTPNYDAQQQEGYEDPLKDKTDLQKALMDILKDFDLQEEPNRSINIRVWKKCENYWHHLQNTYWSEFAGDWKTPDFYYKRNPDEIPELGDYDYKIVNIYRAHGESIVAALSVNTPPIRFFPEDANSSEDVQTAKCYSKAAKMIERQNSAKLLLMRMIYILFNQGLVAVHNYTHESEDYGTTKCPIYGKKKGYFTKLLCPACGETLSEHGPAWKKPPTIANDSEMQCDTCDNVSIPEIETEERDVEYVEREEERPKIRQRIAIYGPLNVKISSYAYDQKSAGILVYDAEQDLGRAQEMYPDIAGNMRTGTLANDQGTEARKPNSAYDAYSRNNVTVRQAWIRPWMFNKFSKTGNPKDDAIVNELKKIFPYGCCLHAVNDTYAESHKESLDSAWSLSFNPMDRYIHSDPIGLGLLPIQDMKNTMVNLSLESIEYGVPETFVDPEVLDLEQYKTAQGGPGMTFPIKSAIPGADISKSFYQNKTSTLTDEAGRLESRIDANGQFISGDYPSIYGGPPQGSDTAAVYSMSRQQALQRLGTTWSIISFLWADVMKRSVDGFFSNLKEDQHYVDKAGENDFINIWIRKNELTGNVGEVYPEGNDQFPVSWAQKRDILMQLIQMQNPMIEAVLSDPNNRTQIANLIGLDEMYIPGDQDRRKQLNEISLLIQQDPISNQASSIPPEIQIDDHLVHMQTCKHWMNSEIGQMFKEDYPSRYMNVMLHMIEHEMALTMGTGTPGRTPEGQPEPSAGNEVG